MKITVNDETQDVSAKTLAGLIDELGYAGTRIATALNGHFVPKAEREGAVLAMGARVEIVAPMQGG